MDLSIVIVNWNTRDLLKQCLQSIESNSSGINVETVVVDNDSADGSAEMVASDFPRVILLQSGGNIGFGRASNLGLTKAKAPLVLFLNPDTEVRDGTLKAMSNFMKKNTKVGALGCKIRDVIGGVKQLGVQWFPSPLTELIKFAALSRGTLRKLKWLLPYQDPHISGEVKKLYGACLLVRRCILESHGAFDDRFFMYCEDVDLCQRIRQAGWQLYYLSDVEILHYGGRASSKAPGGFAVLMGCESFSKLMRKYYGPCGDWAYRLVALLGAQARLLALFAVNLLRFFGYRFEKDMAGSRQKYVNITRWTLGMEKPVVKHNSTNRKAGPSSIGNVAQDMSH